MNLKEIETGLRNVAIRAVNAEVNFIQNLVDLGGITAPEAVKVSAFYRKLKVVKLDAVGGTIRVKHGAYLDRETIRQALVMATAQK